MLPIKLIPNKTNFDFIGQRYISFIFSIIISLLAIVMLLSKGLNYGIDFSGGIVIEARSSKEINIQNLRKALVEHGYTSSVIQYTGNNQNIMIRMQPKEATSEFETIKKIINDADNSLEYRKTDYVGPKVGAELVLKGIYAVVASIIGILIYIGLRFDWKFGICAVVSLIHDALITLGFFSLTFYEFDLQSIAALLTIVGYSINDTVVIYDRIRENLVKYKSYSLKSILNISINETLSRTLMTVITTLLVCLSLVIFGGEVLKGFSIALFFGIAFGTYSSVYIAAPILMHINLKAKL